jgi:hypothetical protein
MTPTEEDPVGVTQLNSSCSKISFFPSSHRCFSVLFEYNAD